MASRYDYIVCTRDVDGKGRFGTEPGSTRFLRVPREAQTYTTQYEIKNRDRWRRFVADAADGEEDTVTGMRGDVLVFVHGYNNDIPMVLWRTRTLQETLAAQGWRGLVVAFDWPSDNQTLNYLEDRWDAAEVALRMVSDSIQVLIDAQDPAKNEGRPCKINVHLLGHSTGAYVIMEAFAQAQKKGRFYKASWRIGQVAFIGGDVAADSLKRDSDWSRPLFERIMRLTNYSNPYDKVLGVSNAKRLGTSPRAGRAGLAADAHAKAVNVDCGDYFLTKDPDASNFRGTFNHSWHIGDELFALDLALTLEGGIDRNALPTRERTAAGLRLKPGDRPPYQEHWDADRPASND